MSKKLKFSVFTIILLLILSLVLFSACGEEGDNGEQTSEDNGKNGGEKKLIGVSIPSADHGWTGGIVWWAQKAAKEWQEKDKNLQIKVITANSPTKQVGDIEDLMVQGIDALVILPHESAPLTPVVKEAHGKGIRIIAVDRGLTEEFGYVNIAGDNAQFGRVSAEYMAEEMDYEGNIVALEGLPVEINTERVEAFEGVMEKYPDIKILESQLANWSTQKGLEIMENYLQKYEPGEIDAVYAQDDDVLKGVLQAYEESGRDDIDLMLGGAGSKDIMKMIIDGHPLVEATVTYHPSMIADGIDYAVDVVKGRKSDDFHNKDKSTRVVIPSELITIDNVMEHYEPDSVY
jgi:ribose transport system substrate-binding protein